MINKSRITKLHTDLNAVLKQFADANNLTLVPFNVSYTESDFKFQVRMGDKSEIGSANPVYVRNLKMYGHWYGLKSEMLGKEFVLRGFKVTFDGMKNKTRVAYTRHSDGKKFHADGVDFATSVGLKVVDLNRGKPLPDFGFNNRHED